MKDNRNKLIVQSIQGRIHHPIMSHPSRYRVGADGNPRICMATGGITYNFKIGDNCMYMVGDHVEPGVSLRNSDKYEDAAFNTFACIGNVAKVITGEAKGKTGFVTGKHGGIEHVMVYFDEETLEQLVVDDKILIKATGLGFELEGYPSIKFLNTSPDLFDKMNIVEKDGILEVGVTHIVPAKLMGSGLGSASMQSGDYDIMTRDEAANEEYNLDSLRFGDIVAILDHHNATGPDYKEGAVTIGVICHGDSYSSGHGPGVTVLFTSHDGTIKPVIDEKSNLKEYYLNV